MSSALKKAPAPLKKAAPAPAKKEEPKKPEPKKEEPKPEPKKEKTPPKEAKKEDDSSSGDSKRAKRATSNVFGMFPQNQIQEFKEAFSLIDQNRDGFIDMEDLKDMFASLGRQPDDKELKEMLNESPGPLNFTCFVTLFGEKMTGSDPEDALRTAFKMFDLDSKGYLEEEYIKDLLENMGDNFTADEVRQTWKEAPITAGKLDYEAFTKIIKRGKEDE